jgi:hypothetical protein
VKASFTLTFSHFSQWEKHPTFLSREARKCNVFRIAIVTESIERGEQMLRAHVHLGLQFSIREEPDRVALRFRCDNIEIIQYLI